jgi:hypothetical protein
VRRHIGQSVSVRPVVFAVMLLALTVGCSSSVHRATRTATTGTSRRDSAASHAKSVPVLLCADQFVGLGGYTVGPPTAHPVHTATQAIALARRYGFGSGASVSAYVAEVKIPILFHKLGYPRSTARLMWVVEGRHGTYRRARNSPVPGPAVQVLDEVVFVDDSRFERGGGVACPTPNS